MAERLASAASTRSPGRKISCRVLGNRSRAGLTMYSPNETEHDCVFELQGSPVGALQDCRDGCVQSPGIQLVKQR